MFLAITSNNLIFLLNKVNYTTFFGFFISYLVNLFSSFFPKVEKLVINLSGKDTILLLSQVILAIDFYVY